jgi:hypothetical protein
VTGPAGPSGPEGIGALVTTGIDAMPILVNHITRNNVKVLGTGKVTVDITPHFRGGKEPIAYTLAPPATTDDTVFADDSVFKAELDKDTGMLTISARSATAAVLETSYTGGEMVTFKATDADKVAADNVMLTVKANREPAIPTSGDDIAIEFMVGAQNAMDAMRDGLDSKGKKTTIQPNPVCATFGSCVFTIKLNDSDENGNATFTANVEGTAPAAGDRQVVITDDDTTGMTFAVVSHDEQVQASASGTTITIVGLKTTYKDGADAPAAVTIEATDAKGLSTERDILVSVDTPPEIKSQFESTYTLTRNAANDDAAKLVISNVRSSFKDAEDSALQIKVATSDDQRVAIDADNVTEGFYTPANLNLIPLNVGSATITVTAVDDRGQMAEQKFTVTVKAP